MRLNGIRSSKITLIPLFPVHFSILFLSSWTIYVFSFHCTSEDYDNLFPQTISWFFFIFIGSFSFFHSFFSPPVQTTELFNSPPLDRNFPLRFFLLFHTLIIKTRSSCCLFLFYLTFFLPIRFFVSSSLIRSPWLEMNIFILPQKIHPNHKNPPIAPTNRHAWSVLYASEW